MRLLTVPVLILVALTTSCAGAARVPLAEPAAERESKTFAVPPDRSLIYVVRIGGYISGEWQLFRVYLDGQEHGSLAPQTYFVFEVEPGQHTVAVSGRENQEVLKVSAQAGRAYFLGIRSRIGQHNARLTVSELRTDQGRAAVRERRLALGLR